MTKRATSACMGSGFAAPQRPGMIVLAALAALLLLAGCHGGTLDAIYPGTLGHDPPPDENLSSQDQPQPQPH